MFKNIIFLGLLGVCILKTGSAINILSQFAPQIQAVINRDQINCLNFIRYCEAQTWQNVPTQYRILQRLMPGQHPTDICKTVFGMHMKCPQASAYPPNQGLLEKIKKYLPNYGKK